MALQVIYWLFKWNILDSIIKGLDWQSKVCNEGNTKLRNLSGQKDSLTLTQSSDSFKEE